MTLPLLSFLSACAPGASGDAASLAERVDAVEAQHEADVAALEARLTAVEASAALLVSDHAALAARVDALEAENETLEAENDALAASAEASEAALAEAEARIDALESGGGGGGGTAVTRLGEALSVDANGDLVLDGVNLYVRSGAGATDAAPNGKGNIILGYAESLGAEARTGSHTLVVGPYHSWTAAWGIVAGESNGLYADGGALIGGTNNTVTHANAVDAGGSGVTSSYTCGFRGSGLQSGSGC